MKIMRGEHHLRNLVIEMEITYSPPSQDGTLVIKLQISDVMGVKFLRVHLLRLFLIGLASGTKLNRLIIG